MTIHETIDLVIEEGEDPRKIDKELAELLTSDDARWVHVHDDGSPATIHRGDCPECRYGTVKVPGFWVNCSEYQSAHKLTVALGHGSEDCQTCLAR